MWSLFPLSRFHFLTTVSSVDPQSRPQPFIVCLEEVRSHSNHCDLKIETLAQLQTLSFPQTQLCEVFCGWIGAGLRTFLHQLSPAFGPLGELRGVALLYARTLVQTIHQVITQSVPVVHTLHRTLVVAHLTDGDTGALQTHDDSRETHADEPYVPPRSCRWRRPPESRLSLTWLKQQEDVHK